MQLTKQQEKELIGVYNIWWDSYLNGDVKTYTSYLDDDFRFVGSTEGEEFLNRKDSSAFFKATADQFAGKARLSNIIRTIEPMDGMVLITDLADTHILSGTKWVYYARFRFTSILRNTKDGWRFFYQHFSTPDLKAQEGETLGVEQISKENLELRDAIKRRTVELEQKNRELEIEGGLERVRARAMAMQNSDELSELVDTLLQELTKLDFSLTACIINIIDGDDKSNTVWVTNPETGKQPESYYLKFEDFRFHHGMWKAWKQRKAKWVYTIAGDEKKMYDEYLFKETEFSRFSKKAQKEFRALDRYVASFTFSNFGGLQTVGDKPLSEESLDILARFGKVFDLTYTRFNDLKQAEAQAREVEIELALERVRARTMAMQHSDELSEASFLLDSQVRGLGIKTWGCAFNIYGKTESTEWFGNEEGVLPTYTLPRKGVFKKYYDYGKKGKDFIVEEFKGKACTDHYEFMSTFPVIGDVLKQLKERNGSYPTYQIDHVVYHKYGYLLFVTLEPVPESHDVFKRFARVFEQTYTRFLDLQKAEAQAREAQIEAALERIRSQVTAMKASADLLDIVVAMRKEFVNLGHEAHYFWHMRWLPDIYEKAMTSGDGSRIGFVMKLPRHIHGKIPLLSKWEKSKKPTVVYAMNAEEAIAYVDKMIALGDFQNIDPQAPTNDDIKHIGGLSFVMARTSHGEIGYSLPGVVKNPPPEDLDILVRFATAFDLAHKRFEDLRQSEIQARETKIELSLERVRSRTMAMQHSDELREVVGVIYEQLDSLNFDANACNIIIMDGRSEGMQYWVSGFTQDIYPESYHVPKLNHPYLNAQFDAWKRADNYAVFEYSGKEKKSFDKLFFTQTEFRNVPEQAKQNMKDLKLVKLSTAYFNNGALQVLGPEPITEENAKTLQRMAKVFDQTYTRFLDLQKAEAQAREAQIEAALERVRSRSMAMHKSEELQEIIQVVFDQFLT